jgi:hypothetical protein
MAMPGAKPFEAPLANRAPTREPGSKTPAVRWFDMRRRQAIPAQLDDRAAHCRPVSGIRPALGKTPENRLQPSDRDFPTVQSQRSSMIKA